jgi:hypothetical protein
MWGMDTYQLLIPDDDRIAYERCDCMTFSRNLFYETASRNVNGRRTLDRPMRSRAWLSEVFYLLLSEDDVRSCLVSLSVGKAGGLFFVVNLACDLIIEVLIFDSPEAIHPVTSTSYHLF